MFMVTELLLDAANLMLIGMVAVFSFLLLLVLIVHLTSSVMQRYFPAKITGKNIKIDAGSKGPAPAVIAAISSAIHQYRQQQQ
jgi:oxaloacetate decarboxylase (Na+ extruding) subunit gamma